MDDPSLESRRKAVDAAREAWIRRLVDTSRRNNLLYFRDLKVGTLDFAGAREGAIDELLLGAKVPLSSLVPDDPKAGARLEEIARKARSNHEERGLETLYLAYGMATWPVEDGGRPPEAAAVLVPLSVEGKSTPMLFRSGPPRANLALLHALAERGYEPDLDEESEDAVLMVGRLQATVPMDGFRVVPRAVVGNFSFQKLAMVRDLKEEGAALAAHDVVAALAGDASARAGLGGRRVAVDPRELDAVPPEGEYLPLDADSSQQAVVQAVARGSDGVIQGPPGCGKSQTIANLVATLVAQGKRVLFVAEKRAALEAVAKRLEAVGLGHLALDLHGATVSQKAIVARIGETLAAIRESPATDEAALNGRFVERRARLVAHERLMHAPLAPSNRSPFALQAAILGSSATSKTRWRGADLARLVAEAATRIEDLLDEAAGHADLFLGRGPWAAAKLDDGAAAQAALDTAATLREVLPEYEKLAKELAQRLGAPVVATLGEMFEIESLALETNRLLERWDVSLIEEAETLTRDLQPLNQGALRSMIALAFNGRFRSARHRIGELSRASIFQADEVDLDLREAVDLAHRWRTIGVQAKRSEMPIGLNQRSEEIGQGLATLRGSLPEFAAPNHPNLCGAIKELLDDNASARAVPRLRAIERELGTLGAGRIVEEIRSGEGSPWNEARAEGGI